MAIFPGLPRHEYDALPGINWSALKCGIGKTAAHIKAAKSGRKDSAALRFGRAFHCYLLQPHEWAKWEITKTKTTTLPMAVTDAEAGAIDAMALSVAELNLGPVEFPETAITWTYGGIDCKAMIDGIWQGKLGDLKSTKDASGPAFGSEIRRYKYHGQMAFYMEGLQRNGVAVDQARLIAVEKTEPYASADHVLSGTWIDAGRRCFEEALEVWADNKPACYGSAVLEMPDWDSGDEFTEDEGGISLAGGAQ